MTKKYRKWEQKEIVILRKFYANNDSSVVVEILAAHGYERSARNVGQKARKLGLSCLVLAKSRFKAGYIPANKGKKISQEIYERLKPTMFSSEKRPDQQVPIGHESFRSHYWMVKIAEKKWAFKHRMLWEAANGPIMDGMCLVFKDGNPHHITLDNLELITRRELIIRNRHGDGPKEYSLITNRAAIARLKKLGITAKEMRENPQLVEMSKNQTLLKLKMRKK